MSPLTRREFVYSAGAAAVGLAAAPQAFAAQPAASAGPLARGKPGQPLAISSGNGERAVARAVELLNQGADPLDAVVAGVNIVEDDPADNSVGLGGLPNENGVVELDACVMHGPTHKAGAVAALQNIRNPSSVARQVMRYSDHVLLVGAGALHFARALGFKEEDLLTDAARKMWLKWKTTHSADDDWLYPEASEEAARRLRQDGIDFTYGTITCLALTPGGDLAGCTSTSGLSYKLAGRVGDSPIIGAGLYVDNGVGACGSTGRGEANLQNCSSFLVVELMRGGLDPTEACLEVLRRVVAHTEKRLLDEHGRPRFDLTLYALRKDGQAGGGTIWSGEKTRLAVHDGAELRTILLPGLYERPPGEK